MLLRKPVFGVAIGTCANSIVAEMAEKSPSCQNLCFSVLFSKIGGKTISEGF